MPILGRTPPPVAGDLSRMKLPLRVCQQVLRELSDRLQHTPRDEGRWMGHRTFAGYLPGPSAWAESATALSGNQRPDNLVWYNPGWTEWWTVGWRQ